MFFFSVCFSRLREERQDVERVLSMENKPRDLSSHNGKGYQIFEFAFLFLGGISGGCKAKHFTDGYP